MSKSLISLPHEFNTLWKPTEAQQFTLSRPATANVNNANHGRASNVDESAPEHLEGRERREWITFCQSPERGIL